MKILMLTDYFYPHIGGVEKVVLDLSCRLVNHGHEVMVLTFNIPQTKEKENFHGIKIVRIKAYDFSKVIGFQCAISVNIFSKLKKIVNEFKPDIIHTHNHFFFNTLVGMLVKKYHNISTITTIHNGSLKDVPGKLLIFIKTYEKIICRLINNNSELVIVGSQQLFENGKKLGIDSNKMVIIPNAVDLSFFRHNRTYSHSPRKVLFVGRLFSLKGPHLLIEAARLVIKKIPDTQFLIVGNGPMRKQLVNLVKSYNISKNVVFCGELEDVREKMKESDLYVRPSLLEGFPYGVLEAMASGLPVLATNIGGTTDLLTHEKTGYLVNPGNIIELANAIIKLLSNSDALKTIANSGLELVEKFSWNVMYDTYENFYLNLLKKGSDFVPKTETEYKD